MRRTSTLLASISAHKSTSARFGLPRICVFREVCVVYVSLSGEYMVSFVQSVEKSIMALQRGDTYEEVQIRGTRKTRRVDTPQRAYPITVELLLLLSEVLSLPDAPLISPLTDFPPEVPDAVGSPR